MTYLVTGGAGFIGSNYVRNLLKNGERVIVLDAFTYAGNPDNLKEFTDRFFLPKSYTEVHPVRVDTSSWRIDVDQSWIEMTKDRWKRKFEGYKITELTQKSLDSSLKDTNLAVVIGNIVDRDLVQFLMKNADVVIHFAAETHVDRSILRADEFVKTDIYGTYVLLEAARSSKVEKFVHVSTDEVYGQAMDKKFKEEDPINPRNPYSASKAGADRLVWAYSQTYDLPVIILRPSNNFGPYQYPEKLIPVVITRALRNEEIPVYGDGRQIRDWLYVQDTAKAIDLVIEKGRIGEVYNIAGRNERENTYVVKTILKLLNKSERLIKHVKDRPGHDRRYALDDIKIRELGFESIRFEDVIEDVVKWYVDNKWWWEKILKMDVEYRVFIEKWYSRRTK